jgi:hypothetical protein
MSVPTPASPGEPRSVWTWLLQFGLAFAWLNLLLTLENRWPGFGVRAAPRLSFELCLAVVGLMGWVAWRGQLSRRAISAATLGFLLLVAARYADVTAPAVLGRPVNLYWDGRHGLELLRVAAASLSTGQAAVLMLAFGVGLALLTGVTWQAIKTLARCLAWRRPRPLLLATVAVLTLSFAAYTPGERDTRWFFALPLAPTLYPQAVLITRVLLPEQGDAELGASPSFDGGLNGLIGAEGPADVLLLFAESYGAVSIDQPPVAAALAALRAALGQAIEDSGRSVVSARVRSPAFGGGSWLAHAAVLSGLPMSDPGRHELLLASRRPTLVSHFARHGYRTVGWMPGIKRDWPEGAFYGYARLADDPGLGYRGPDFGYWRIPDQAAMALLHHQELVRHAEDSARKPRFVVFPTTTSHAPFHPLPPFTPAWAQLATSMAYTAEDVVTAQTVPVGAAQALPTFIAAMGYQFTWLADYVRRLAPHPLVIVIVGDHQPPALVTGPGASWDVPVHVISGDPALLQRLQARGFVRGLQPPAAALGPMHALTPLLLEAFDGPAAAPAAATAEADSGARVEHAAVHRGRLQ